VRSREAKIVEEMEKDKRLIDIWAYSFADSCHVCNTILQNHLRVLFEQ
jgi:hypothetical protein